MIPGRGQGGRPAQRARPSVPGEQLKYIDTYADIKRSRETEAVQIK